MQCRCTHKDTAASRKTECLMYSTTCKRSPVATVLCTAT